jgi:hypothetical protein
MTLSPDQASCRSRPSGSYVYAGRDLSAAPCLLRRKAKEKQSELSVPFWREINVVSKLLQKITKSS